MSTIEASSNGKPEAYPDRPRYFANRYCRLLTKTCAAQEIGHVAFCLCVTVALQEDSKRYKGAVTYYNEQLLPLIGVRKWDSLDRARKRAAEHGWLHYESGGRRKPGRYWVTIPNGLDDLDDTPCDESRPPANGDNAGEVVGSSYPANGDNVKPSSPQLYPRNGDNGGDNNGDNGGDLSSLSLPPIPKGEPASAGAPAELLALIDGWNDLPTGIIKSGNGARRDPVAKATLKGWRRAQGDRELREAFGDIPRLLKAIEGATFCHGQPWFSLPWLFATNKSGEFNAVKLLNGGYENGNGKPTRPVSDSPARIRRRGREYWESIPVEGGEVAVPSPTEPTG